MSIASAMEKLSTTKFLSSCLRTGLLLVSVFHTGISSVKADVRCFCNLPVCVTSGYMCKSSIGVCVTDHFGYSGDTWRARHACLELVEQSDDLGAEDCPERTDLDSYSTRFCCVEDMCNYARNILDPLNPLYRLNHSYITGYLSNEDFFFRHGGFGRGYNPNTQQQLWFKAAVIAVPIAGGFILILLIVMAARMLKADHKRQRQWSEAIKRQNQELQQKGTETRILFSDEMIGKKSKSSIIYFPKSLSSTVLQNFHPQIHRDYASVGSINQFQNNLYRNVSIAISTDTACTDSSKDKYFVFDL